MHDQSSVRHWRRVRPCARASSLRWPGVLAIAALAACDLPTAAPKFEQQWAVPVATNKIAIVDLLPASVQVVQGAFRVPLQPSTATVSLHQVCTVCPTGQILAPKPEFDIPLALTMVRPTDFASASVAGRDTARLKLTHNFGFAVLNPAGATAPGSLVVELVLGADTVRAIVSGAANAWPSGSTLDVPLPLPAGAKLTSDVGLAILINSPAGDDALMDGSAALTATVTIGTLDIASISSTVPSKSISSADVTLDLSQVDSEIASKATAALLTVDVANPLDVAGDFTLTFKAGNTPVISPKTVPIKKGSTSTKIALTRSELDKLLGQRITLGLAGGVAATQTNGLVTIRPTDVITVDSRLALTIVLP